MRVCVSLTVVRHPDGVRRLGVLAAVLLVFLPSSGTAANTAARAGVFTGYGFDACTAPSTAALNAWSASPYRAVGIYLGGVNRACGDGNLNATWITSTLAAGWSLLPLYVGLQAPCVSGKLSKISSNLTTAGNQGRTAADDAVSLTGKFALPGGTPIYYDMEGYSTTNASCTKVVQAFVSAWVNELHAQGFVAGVYGSAASTIRDIATLGSSLPDAAWIANWNGVEGVFGDPHVSDSIWANHQRVHQYKGGHKETWGGVSINIDSNYVDGPVLGGLAPPPPPPPPPAGSVGSGDNRAAVSWPDGAFTTPVAVALTPVTPPPANGYAVQLTVTDTDTSTPVTTFGAALTLHITGCGRARAVLLDRRPDLDAAAEDGLQGRLGRRGRHPDHGPRVLRAAARHRAADPARRLRRAVPERRAPAQLAGFDRQCGSDRLV